MFHAGYTSWALMARQALVVLAVVVAFGVLVPWYKGFGFLDPRIIAAYACLALLFVAPASADLAALYAEKASPAAVLARMAVIVAYGWGITVLILVTGLVTMNLGNHRGGFAAPPWRFLTALLVFSLMASFSIAALCAVLARRFSASGIKAILRTGFLVLLLLFVFGARFLPESWQTRGPGSFEQPPRADTSRLGRLRTRRRGLRNPADPHIEAASRGPETNELGSEPRASASGSNALPTTHRQTPLLC